jgi:hypothetical protein
MNADSAWLFSCREWVRVCFSQKKYRFYRIWTNPDYIIIANKRLEEEEMKKKDKVEEDKPS